MATTYFPFSTFKKIEKKPFFQSYNSSFIIGFLALIYVTWHKFKAFGLVTLSLHHKPFIFMYATCHKVESFHSVKFLRVQNFVDFQLIARFNCLVLVIPSTLLQPKGMSWCTEHVGSKFLTKIVWSKYE